MSNPNCCSANAITRHPLRDLLGDEAFAKLGKDVQFCRASWPLLVEIRRKPDVEEPSE